MKYYKLTEEDGRTYSGTQWGEGITHKAVGKGNALCSSDVIHLYDHPLKATLFNLNDANFLTPRLWSVRARQIVADDGIKVGAKQVTTLKELPLPAITTNQCIRFAIYCALAVYKEKSFVRWAERWLSGEDRTGVAARHCVLNIYGAFPAFLVASHARDAAIYAAEAPFRVTAYAAAAFATVYVVKNRKINFAALIKKAMKEEK